MAVTSIPSQIPDLEEQIEISAEPTLPKPGDTVKLTLSAFGVDLNTASISWNVNGSSYGSGIGKTSITFVAKSNTSVTVTISPVNSKSITKSYTIKAATVDLIWEADTYVPPFYRGKTMYTPQEKVKFTAIMPGAVTYKWSQDQEVQGSLSGNGVQSFYYKGSILMLPVSILVDVTDQNGATAENYLTLKPKKPLIGLYENSSIYGILFNRELSGEFDFGEKEERSIAAYPYYFGTKGRSDSNLAYAWSINGYDINVPSSQNNLTLRNEEGKEGRSIIGVGIKNISNILESATDKTTVNFVKPKSNFFF